MKCQIFIILVLASVALGQFYGRRRLSQPTTTTEAWPELQTDPTPGNRRTDGRVSTDPWPQDPRDPATEVSTDPWPQDQTDPWPSRPQRTRPQRPSRPSRRPNRRPARRPNGGRNRRPGNGRRTRRPLRPTTNPRFAETTTRPSITQGGDLCNSMIVGAGCEDFYGCFLARQTACSPDEADFLRDLAGLCLISENVEDDNQFGDQRGRDFIEKYRRCSQERILPTVDSNSCDVIEDKAEEILVTPDVIWDCLYQNNTLCDVVENSENSIALALIFQGTGRINQRIYRHLMNRVSQQCGSSAGRQFADDFGQTFLSNMMNNMPGTMMMGGNGGD